MQNEIVEFVKAAIKNPRDVSTVFPTSRWLTKRLLDEVPITQDSFIVEVGAGTGAITQHLYRRLMHPKEQYLGVELNPQMVSYLRTYFPNLKFEQGPAQNLDLWLKDKKADGVVSSLPWTIFSEQVQTETLQAIYDSLKPGGVFATYMCLNSSWYPQAKRFKQLIHQKFHRVDRTPVEWKNIPPAFVFRCTK